MTAQLYVSKTTEVINRSSAKLAIILSEPSGWLAALLLSLLVSFKDAAAVFVGLGAIITIDAILGVIVSLKKGSYFMSYLARESVWKVVLYMSFLISVHVVEWILGNESFLGMRFCFVIIALIEVISISSNACIIKPKFPFFKFIQKYLKSEIARKLGIEESEVSNILDANDLKNLKSDREKLHEQKL